MSPLTTVHLNIATLVFALSLLYLFLMCLNPDTIYWKKKGLFSFYMSILTLFLFQLVFACIGMYGMCVYVCWHMCVQMCICACRGLRSMSGVLLDYPLTYSLRQSLWIGELQVGYLPTWHSVVSGIWTLLLCLRTASTTHWATYPALSEITLHVSSFFY